jgi:peptidoglycan/LPS O-acetylase OafA/YrhL
MLDENIKSNPVLKTTKKIDFNILDGLRGIAAVYVVFNHARGNLFIGGEKYAQIKNISDWSIGEKIFFSAIRLTSLGREFVILFFILSGFSIAYSLSKTKSKKTFYLRRVIRIYPPYIFALIWAFIVFVFLQNFALGTLPSGSRSVFSSLKDTLLNLFYVDNGSLIIQFWSLKYEVIFYILIPLFILKKNLYLITSLAIAIISVFVNWRGLSGNSILTQYILDYNFYFALGVFCFHYYTTIERYLIFKSKTQFFIVSIILFLTMVIFKFWTGFDQDKVTFFIAGLFSVILLFNFLYHKIKTRSLMFLGKISYTTYVTHFASLMLFSGILLKTGVIDSMEIQNKFLWLLAIPFSLGLSYFFYLIVEKPTKQILIKLRKSDK